LVLPALLAVFHRLLRDRLRTLLGHSVCEAIVRPHYPRVTPCCRPPTVRSTRCSVRAAEFKKRRWRDDDATVGGQPPCPAVAHTSYCRALLAGGVFPGSQSCGERLTSVRGIPTPRDRLTGRPSITPCCSPARRVQNSNIGALQCKQRCHAP